MLDSFIKKPDIKYVVKDTITTDPGAYTPQNGEDTFVDVSVTKSELETALIQLKAELEQLSILEDSIISTLPAISIQVSAEDASVIGKSTVTVSDYLTNMSGETYGAIRTCEIYEDYNSDYNSSCCNEGALLLPAINITKQNLISGISTLESDTFSDYYNDNAKATKEYTALRDATAAGKAVLAKEANRKSKDAVTTNTIEIANVAKTNSQKLRSEIDQSVILARYQIQRCMINNLMYGSTGSSAYSGGRGQSSFDLLGSLKSIRAALKLASIVASLDWKSAINNIRTSILREVFTNSFREAYNLQLKLVDSIVNPIEEMFSAFRSEQECPIFDAFTTVIGNTVEDHKAKYMQLAADYFNYNENVGKLTLDSARKAKAVLIANKWLPLLDAAIYSLESLSNTGTIDKTKIDDILCQCTSIKHPLAGAVNSGITIDKVRSAMESTGKPKPLIPVEPITMPSTVPTDTPWIVQPDVIVDDEQELVDPLANNFSAENNSDYSVGGVTSSPIVHGTDNPVEPFYN